MKQLATCTELDLHLSRERAALAPFSRISGVGHCGSWPPLHCGDSTKPYTGGCSWCLIPLWGSLTWVWEGTPGDWRLRANSTCRSRALGTTGADCSRVARATIPGPPPQPHGWVRLGFEVSKFPHFGLGDGMCQLSQGCGVSDSLAPVFSSYLSWRTLPKVLKQLFMLSLMCTSLENVRTFRNYYSPEQINRLRKIVENMIRTYTM